MSVKIISKPPNRVTCSRCKCVYEFEYSDLERFTHGSSRRCPNGIRPYYGIKCPCCGKIEEIYSEQDGWGEDTYGFNDK